MMGIVAARLAKGLDSPGWADQRLADLTRVRKELEGVVASVDVMAPWQVGKAIREAGRAGWKAASDDLKALGLPAGYGVYSNTGPVLTLAKRVTGQLAQTHLPMLRAAEDAYRDAILAEAQTALAGGGSTAHTAMQRSLDRFAEQGIGGFVDKAGRTWRIDSYAEMAMRTTIAQASVQQAAAKYAANGRDLVIVTDSPQECPLCRPWEGKVLSLSGASSEYPSLDQAISAGLFHANCTHGISAYVPGLTVPFKNTANPEGYEARQRQRALERRVRAAKRRQEVAVTPEAKARAKKRLAKANADLAAHVEANGLKRLRYREVNYKPKAVGPNAPKAMKPKPAPAPAPTPAPAPVQPAHATGGPLPPPHPPAASAAAYSLPKTKTGATDVKGFAHDLPLDDDHGTTLKTLWANGAKNADVEGYLDAVLPADHKAAYAALTKAQKASFHNHLKLRYGVEPAHRTKAPKLPKSETTLSGPARPFSPMTKPRDNAATVRYFKSARSKLKQWVDQLDSGATPKLRAAARFLRSYKGSAYREINNALRKKPKSAWPDILNKYLPKHPDYAGMGNAGRSKLLLEALDDIMDSSRTTEDMYLFRSFKSGGTTGKTKILDVWDTLPGSVFEDKGFISTSLSGNQQFNGSWGDIMCVIHAPAGTKGVALELMANMHESELVLPPTRFRVLGCWKLKQGEVWPHNPSWGNPTGARYVVEMEVIDQPWLTK